MTSLGIVLNKGNKPNSIKWICCVFSSIFYDYLTFLSKKIEFSKASCLNTSH